jgi:hypothetical protein
VAAVSTVLMRSLVTFVRLTLALLPWGATATVATRFWSRVRAVARAIVVLTRSVGHVTFLLLAAVIVVA